MTALVWDDTGKRYFETGVDHGVLYPMDPVDGDYPLGVAWNGLTAVTESPSGAEANPFYADNTKYLNLISAEEFGGTIEAYTYPDEFMECDGSAQLLAANGLTAGQQPRKQFGLVYRTKKGNDVAGQDLGYLLHLVYGCLAAPSERAYASVNDSPEPLAFSWEFTTTPTNVNGHQPTACLIIDSTKVNAGKLATLEQTLFGAVAVVPSLPMPDAVVTALTP